MTRALLITLLVVIARIAGGQEAPSRPAITAAELLGNMPVNSDSRCLGITLVAAALLEGEPLAGGEADRPQALAEKIFEGAFTGKRVPYYSKLRVGNQDLPLQSRAALDSLATAVADRYKQRYLELVATAGGHGRLLKAQRRVLTDRGALDALLAADGDGILPVLLQGDRRFADGELKATSHAALITKNAQGEKVVYDPNDPGQPIPCELETTADGLMIEWTCRYRNTGKVTTQRYLIIDLQRYFREGLSRE